MQGLIAREIVYALRAEKQYVGIFINITTDHLNAERLQKVKDDTAVQARELHEHQIEMARQFANFLGEYTAKGEQLVNKLIQAVESKDVVEDKDKKN
jgi:Ni,Fe-hydrogenase I large subunit